MAQPFRKIQPVLQPVAPTSDSVPAVILCDPATAGLRVAGLTVADRLVVAAHRAGCAPVMLAGPEKPQLARAEAFAIPVTLTPAPPTLNRPALWMDASLLASVADLKVLIQSGGQLQDNSGALLPAGMASGPASSLQQALTGLPAVTPSGVARRVTDAASAREAGKALWASIKSGADGLVDRVFNRPCGRPLSKLLVHTPVSPNMVSVVSILIGVAAAWLFAQGEYAASLLAAIVFQISAIVDCVDGDVARVALKESPLGKWLDLAGDQVVHISVFAGIAWGAMKTHPPALWLGASAVAGALLSFAVVVRGMRLAKQDGMAQRFIDAATNRDFSVLVLFLAALGRLEWFLWLTAIGSHAFWMTALALQGFGRPASSK